MIDHTQISKFLEQHARASGTHLNTAPHPVIVLGLCKHGLYLTRLFSRHGIPVIALASDLKVPSARTRYGFKVFCKDLNDVPLIDTLTSIQAALPGRTPIFPTNDKMVDVLLAYYSTLETHFRLPFPNSKLLTRLKDKAELDQLAVLAGLPVPRSHVVQSTEDLKKLQDDIRFPVAVKPTLPMSSFKSRRCENLAQLMSQVAQSAALKEPLIVQEWIEGDDRAILFGAYYIGHDGKCLATYAGRKLMSYPPIIGHAAATESADIGDRLKEGVKFLQDLGYWGLCSIEYKGISPDKVQFIEVTVGRCDWWIMCCGINGVEIPMAAYNDLADAQIPFGNTQTSDYVWHDIEHSLPVLIENVMRGSWSLQEVLAFLSRPKKDAIFDIHDIAPFFHSLRYYLARFTSKVFGRLKKLLVLARGVKGAG